MDPEWTYSTYVAATIIYSAFFLGCLAGLIPEPIKLDEDKPAKKKVVTVSIKSKPKKKKKKKKVKVEVAESIEEEPILTSMAIVEDTITCLRSLGHSKKEVESIVIELSRKKRYESVDRLIKDVYKKHS